MNKKALITGITGMDGSHLADLLVSKGYEVHGTKRHISVDNTYNIKHLLKDDSVILHDADLLDYSSLFNVINKVKPDEIYNLAAQSHAGVSFKIVENSLDVDGIGVARILEIIRQVNPKIKMFQASTSEFLDSSAPLPWNEDTKIAPDNPYGCGKAMAHYLVRLYRKAYGLFAVNGIMFNHESERRGETFVTRKITKAVARIKKGEQKELLLGNIEAKRDWGMARCYMYGAWLMLQQEQPKDYVLATGETHSVREWLEKCFEYVGLNAYDYYKEDARFMRPSDIPIIQGDASLIKKELGWEADIKFNKLIEMMMDAELSTSLKNDFQLKYGVFCKHI